MITLLCPTRDRPEQLKRMWNSARATAYNPELLSLCVGLDEGHAMPHLAGNVHVITGKDYGIVYLANKMAIASLGMGNASLFMSAADDTIFTTPGWDKALIDAYMALNNKVHVFCLRDSRDITGTPHPIVTREYISAMGYFFTPLFLHWYTDTWTTEIAKANGIFTHLLDYELVHDKPSDRGIVDDTHARVRERGWHERDSYVNATCRHVLEGEKERLKRIMQHMVGTREHMD